jgi:hypothetical protein
MVMDDFPLNERAANIAKMEGKSLRIFLRSQLLKPCLSESCLTNGLDLA